MTATTVLEMPYVVQIPSTALNVDIWLLHFRADSGWCTARGRFRRGLNTTWTTVMDTYASRKPSDITGCVNIRRVPGCVWRNARRHHWRTHARARSWTSKPGIRAHNSTSGRDTRGRCKHRITRAIERNNRRQNRTNPAEPPRWVMCSKNSEISNLKFYRTMGTLTSRK